MNCKNCDAQLPLESSFCHSCGGKVIKKRLTFKNLFEHVSETFLNYDNKLLRTLIDLFKKPEQVIQPYIDGVRKRYINPVSFFALALTLSGIYMIILTKFYPETLDYSFMTLPGQEEIQRKNQSFIVEYQSIVMMFYIPLYALIARITFIDLNKFNYTELLVIFMFIQAQISIVGSIIVLVVCLFGFVHGALGLILIPPMIVYTAFCLRRLYSVSFGQMILRTFFFFVIFAVAFIIVIIIVVIITHFNGDVEQMKEVKNAAGIIWEQHYNV